VADQMHAVQILRFEQIEVEQCDVVDGADPVRILGVPNPG